MEQATVGTGPRIAIAAITASKTNPRKRFDEAALAELADSIKRHDVLQPILLRPHGPETFELVAGERRFRAAKAAGLVDIPATVRELTDAEVLEIQVVENLQRKDLHELEEAEGYEALLKCSHPNGDRYTVDEIAAKVGKSRSYVFARLKLCALCPEARKAFYAGDLDASRALLIARIGHHDTQRQALKDVTQGEYNRGAMSYREAHEHILRNYMLKLSEAPFDIKDAGLQVKAGACGPCPKRTGNQADLFGDVKSADVCTDPKCFDDKRQAHYRTATVSLEAQGFKVIAGDAAKKALPGWEHRRQGSYMQFGGGYERFDGSTYVNGRSQKVSALFDRDFKPTKLQHPLTGEIFEVVTQQAIAAAAKKRAKDAPTKKKGAKSSSSSGPKERKPTAEEIYNARLMAAIMARAPKQLSRDDLALLARDMMDSMDINESDALAAAVMPAPTDEKARAKFDAHDAFTKALAKMDAPQLHQVLFGCIAARGLGGPGWFGGERIDSLKIALKRTGVDPAKVKKAIAEEAKAAEAAKAKPAAKLSPKERKFGPANKASAGAKALKKKRRPVADFMKPMKASATLAAVIGDKPMPRTEITSKVWGYIKKNDLQDKTNRRMINADEKLLPLFNNRKQVSMFDMTKLIRKHLS